MAAALINVPAKAKTRRDHRDQDADRRTSWRPAIATRTNGAVIPRDIITSFTCRYNGARDLPRRSVAGDRRQSVHLVLHRRDRERQARVRMDRRQRLSSETAIGRDHGRMRLAGAHCGWRSLLIGVRCRSLAGEIPRDERRSGYQLHGPRHAGRCRTTTPPIPACCGCSTARRCGARRPAPPARPAPTAMAMRATSMKGVAARYPAFDQALDRPVDLEQRINLCRTTISRRRRCAYESRDLLALDRLRRAAVARHADRGRRRPQLAPFVAQGARPLHAARRASSISPAPIAMTTIADKQLAGATITQAPSDRLSALSAGMAGAGLAAAAAAQLHHRHARRRPMITARPSWSSSNSI